MVLDAHANLPMASYWGMGIIASSDSQFLPAARQGEATNLVNAPYGSEPGLKALYPRLRSLRTVRHADDPGDGE